MKIEILIMTLLTVLNQNILLSEAVCPLSVLIASYIKFENKMKERMELKNKCRILLSCFYFFH